MHCSIHVLIIYRFLYLSDPSPPQKKKKIGLVKRLTPPAEAVAGGECDSEVTAAWSVAFNLLQRQKDQLHKAAQHTAMQRDVRPNPQRERTPNRPTYFTRVLLRQCCMCNGIASVIFDLSCIFCASLVVYDRCTNQSNPDRGDSEGATARGGEGGHPALGQP